MFEIPIVLLSEKWEEVLAEGETEKLNNQNLRVRNKRNLKLIHFLNSFFFLFTFLISSLLFSFTATFSLPLPAILKILLLPYWTNVIYQTVLIF